MQRRMTSGGLFLLLCIAAHAWAGDLPRAQPQELGFSAERLQYLDTFFAGKVEKGEMAGVVTLVARHGRVAHLSAIGYADVEKRQKLRTDSIFRLYSMTKPIVSTALMTLYEQGRFQMQDPVSKYIPELAHLRVLRTPDSALGDTVPLERPPTVEDLMRHTAGFGHGFSQNAVDSEYRKADLFGVDVSLAEMVARLAKIPLICQPGTRNIYSVGPDVQARLVEVLSGMPFDRFLQQKLFAPLGMTDTAFWLAADKAGRLSKVHWERDGKLVPLDEAHGYPKDDGFLAEPWSVNSYTVDHRRKGGSYGLVGTAEDYWRFAQMMLNGGELSGVRVLGPRTVRYMTRDHMNAIAVNDPSQRSPGMTWGLGFGLVKDPAAMGYVVSEGTFFWGGAAGTQFWVDPREDLVGVAMIQHLDTPAVDSFREQLHALVYSALMQ